jgi:hypothetical protein
MNELAGAIVPANFSFINKKQLHLVVVIVLL